MFDFYNPDLHHRRSIRLKGYNYSRPGVYFVTICTEDRECLFGEIVGGEMHLNDAGRMVREIWNELPHRFPHIQLDRFIIMPNHMHGIIVINETIDCRGESCIRPMIEGDHKDRPYGTRPKTLGRILQAYKSITTYRYVRGINENHCPPFRKRLWQRNYYEHVVRNEDEMNRIREYILNNPAHWPEDENHPERVKKARQENFKELGDGV
jgi:REP element-mobilizing transposase RayT